MKSVKQTKKTTTTKTPARKATLKAVTPVVAAGAAPAPQAQTKAVTATKPTRTVSTTIEARIDVGFGNQLFVRGQGAGLSWERGVPLKNVDSSTWQWTAAATDKLTFKLLLNDAVWAQGADVIAAPGQKVELTPNF
jgi:hypothetical protein